MKDTRVTGGGVHYVSSFVLTKDAECMLQVEGVQRGAVWKLPDLQGDGFKTLAKKLQGFPCGSDGKESACNAGDMGSIPGLGRSPGQGNGNPLRYSCLENPVDGGA